ncbi:MAG: hypothetical protein PHY59_04675 [Methanobacterium sp.]|nr:hypothetical protein [Methanobacterium sp.]
MIFPVQIILTVIFSNKTVEFVVLELKRDKYVRKFFEIKEVANVLHFSAFLSGF